MERRKLFPLFIFLDFGHFQNLLSGGGHDFEWHN